MGGAKKNDDPFQWFEEKINYLRKDREMLLKVSDVVAETGHGPWSLLKLVSLGYINSMYTHIVGKIVQRKTIFKKMYYIDLFSGPGIIRLKDLNATFLGSPFVAINSAKKPFDHLFFVDIKEDYIEALEKRLNKKAEQKGFEWVKKYTTFVGDVNKKIEEIVELVSDKNAHALIFIDPYGMQPTWEKMEDLLKNTQSDVLVNIMAYEAKRAINTNQAKQWLGPMYEKIDKNVSREQIAKLYTLLVTQTPDLRKKPREKYRLLPVKAPSKVKDEPYYYLLYCVVKTKQDNPWLNAPDRVLSKLQLADEKTAKWIIDRLEKGQKSMTDFFKEEKEKEKNTKQSTLDPYF